MGKGARIRRNREIKRQHLMDQNEKEAKKAIQERRPGEQRLGKIGAEGTATSKHPPEEG